MRETGAPLFAATRLRFAFTACLRTLIVAPATGLGENARLLHFAVKLLERSLKRAIRIYNNLAHQELPARSTGILVPVAARLVAVLAIDGAIFARLEGHAGLFSTARADGRIHGAGLAVTETSAALAAARPSLISA